MSTRIAFLGPAGSYAEQAAMNHNAAATLVPFPSIPSTASSVPDGEADEAVVPIENSLEGSVNPTLDILVDRIGLFIRHELVLPIDHCLMTRPGSPTDAFEVIFSHPQALAQCRRFLQARYPEAELVASLSTSASVSAMSSSRSSAAAIASRRAAELYGAEIVHRGIQDDPNNETRFVVLAPADHAPTGADKTSICFDFEDDAPGILYGVLGEFMERGINMAKIESRPTRRSLGRYIFLVDLEGHRQDQALAEALDAVKRQVSMFKVFGSYPMHVSSAIR
jgi:prephenate dehydratase